MANQVTLKKKGDEAYVSLKQLMVKLKWTAAVDLDLMAFYKAKDGRTGAVCSDNYAGGSLGSMNAFPFIELSGDAGVGAAGGDNEEVLRISQLDGMEEVYICAVIFAEGGRSAASFSSYDGLVEVNDDKGEKITVPLDSDRSGQVAIIAKIDNTSFMGAKLINMNNVVDMKTLKMELPGTADLELASKISLGKKGDAVQLKMKGGAGVRDFSVNLNWTQKSGGGLMKRMLSGGGQAIDLDLGCLFELTDGRKGSVQALGNSFGALDRPPYIMLSGDDRTGGTEAGETIFINPAKINDIKRILFYTFIYEGAANWSQANGVVMIKSKGSPDIEIRLDNHQDGMIMCALALFENTGGEFKVKRLVDYYNGHPDMDRAHNWGMRWVAGQK